MNIKNLQREVHAANIEAGWWDGIDKTSVVERLAKSALIVTEVAEAVEGFRKGINDDHLPHRPMAEVELADAIIRILDLGEACGFDIESAILEKMAYNKVRSDHKRENRAKEGGKKY